MSEPQKIVPRASSALFAAILLTAIFATGPLPASPATLFADDAQNVEEAPELGWNKGVMKVIKEKFPDDYRRILGRTAFGTVKSIAIGDPNLNSVRIEAAKASADILRKNKDYLLTAPPGVARAYFDAYSAFLRTMEADPALCSKYLEQGYMALTPSEATRLDMARMQAAAEHMLNGIALGRDLPVEADPATPDDWRTAFLEWVSSPKVKADWFALISGNKVDNPEYCTAFISLVDGLRNSRSPAAERVSRHLMYMLAGG